MPRPSAASLPLLRFSQFDGIRHAVSTRHGGISPVPYASLNMSVSTGDSEDNVTVNRRRLVEALGGSADRTLVGRLSHGNHVSVFRRDDTLPDEQVFRSDGVVSDVPGLFVLLTFADCVPLLFWDTARGVIGAAHAGWRGTALGIAPAVIQTMVEDFGSNPADVVVGIGPSIGPCCYAVCHDVLQAF